MLVIFGLRTRTEVLRWVTFVCRVCGQGGPKLVLRDVTKFSLFFIPLFPVRVRYAAECRNPACRSRTSVSAADADRMPASTHR
ncbi:zinc ribbon domain-containing protein [Dactylosporangium matsuzakiense]|uniref:zinc ribbon domain-containing protein n=1 Tax=Dactylosporangium matsuzakiense TaxID=53360 RepID=UPI0021C44B03|nr:zinc ribbon domain-containing protein [Dactylosporangium matsuzakiense]UWZ48776.1 zinc-ribbon domain-containing protein [Dactylosporangium matsuzakiense]